MSPKILFADLLPGETPIDDFSGLLVTGVTTRKELSQVEGQGIRKILVKYFTDPHTLDFAPPSRDIAPFDFEWTRQLHREMYGEI